MISVSGSEANKLRNLGFSEDVHMVNVTHKSKHKAYFLTENREALIALSQIRKVK